ncbi:glycoside hydrolase family 2 protein [Botryobacter ruber]|uniref:glycoside hydrolase family 2 protein n=1 Tax=Botryobacter ruber TaxID=2171629 RepID=UPI000E09EE26|nr:sugar-binding domain-containing protein [Botryobacter ruber]
MKRLTIFFLLLLLVAGKAKAQGWKPVGDKLKTRWAKDVSPANAWQEYPRPQLVRDDWQNLNGLWEYAIRKKGLPQPAQFDGKILVPYAVESSLSGVGKPLLPDQELWYRTTFETPASWRKQNAILHFEAVDWQATVYLNNKLVGEHKGGSDAFSFDVSKYLKPGVQELVVKVWDPTDSDIQPRGKQILKPHGFWYTAVSGIWQTVWLEPVSPSGIRTLVPEPDIDRKLVTIKSSLYKNTGKERVRLKVTYKDNVIAEQEVPYQEDLAVAVPEPQLWTPEYPNLYQFQLEIVRGGKVLDKVASYFAMRKIALGQDNNGYTKLFLNNKPYFQWGVLDQGWWPDGLLTPPSDEAMKYDMEVVKSMGYNMIRKHIKVEPARFYFHADTMGLLVWQDMPSGFLKLGHPEQHVNHDAPKDWERPKASAQQFEHEWKSIIDHLRFFPSIVVWVPFNEGWGQYDTERVVEWTRQYDPTRLVDGTSGWTDRNVGHMYDAHQYPGPSIEPSAQNPGRALVLGEFGGLGFPVKDHLWNAEKRNWGYRTYLTAQQLIDEYVKLVHNVYPLTARGLAAAIYTQTTDVEGEVNGLMTYDREIIKVPVATARILHEPLYYQHINKQEIILKDSEEEASPLMTSFTYPGREWNNHNPFSPAFKKTTGPVKVSKGQTLWAVNSFVKNDLPDRMALKVFARGDLKIYLNGHLIHDRYTLTKRHYDEINISEFARYLKEGKNVIGLELQNAAEDSEFDFGLYHY